MSTQDKMNATPLSGRSGRIKLGSAITITGATHAAGIITVTAANSLVAGMFVLISGVVGMTDLNNGGKGHIVIEANATTFKVEKTTSQTYTSGGTAKRIIPITKWDLDVKSQSGEATTSESGEWKERLLTGFKEWSFSYEGIEFDGADQMIIQEMHDVELDIDENNYYSGSAVFETFKTGSKITDANAMAVSGTASGSGPLVKTNNDLT